MLASITPLGERGRQSRWPLTVGAFLLGATAAGVGLGALIGALGSLLLGQDGGASARLALLAGALVLAAVLDALHAVPGPRRQVNERWLDEFRGWVYGIGFGGQLGIGVTTVVSSAAMYVAFLAAFLTGSAAAGAIVVGCFGAVRGLTPLVGVRVHRPDQLVAMLARLERLRPSVAWASPALLTCALLVAGIESLT